MEYKQAQTHKTMWNRDFSRLIAAELLLCIACYMTIPFLPYQLYVSNYVTVEWACLTMVAFVAGICVSGFFGCWLIQRYRRNKVFFVSALCLGLTIIGMSWFSNPGEKHASDDQIIALMSTCLFGGFVFGNAKRVLSCTLLIDKTESCHRTEANYAAIWIARLTVVVGPVIAILLRQDSRDIVFYGIAGTAAVISALIVMTVKFPFRAPEEGTRIISIDRFFLPKGWNVALVITLMSAALGTIMAANSDTNFFSSLIAGFAIAIVTLRYKVVRTGRYTSAIGNVCILTAMLAMTLHNGLLDDTLKPMLLGIGFGLTSSEQLYKLLDLCDHCQRSTAESTYFTASDGGLFLGLAAGWGYGNLTCTPCQAIRIEHIAITLFIAATFICGLNAIVKRKHIEYHA